MKAVLHYRTSPGFRTLIVERVPAWLEVVVVDETDTHTFAATMHNTDVLLHVLEPVTAAVIQAAPCLRLIQKIGVGVNTIERSLDVAIENCRRVRDGEPILHRVV